MDRTPRTHDDGLRRTRNAPLDLSPDEFRRLGHGLVDRVADLLGGLAERPVTPAETPTAVRAILEAESGLPEEGSDPGALLERAATLLFDHSLYNGHPRFLGYITAPAAPIGVLGEMLAGAVNPNVGAWPLSPMASEIEAQTVRWIAELIGYPTDCAGLLVSGGNMANLTGFLAAVASVPAEVARDRLRVYASAETHTWIHKAVDVTGLGASALRSIGTDGEQRLDVAALRTAIEADRAAGEHPFLVVGTAGSVSTGAVDPLPAIAALCREHALWFHVDGAYGAFAAAVPEAPDDLRGLSEADSVAVDPHKWLYAPLEAGGVLVRDAGALRRAFSHKPPYYHFGEAATSFFDLGLQNSRGFRALKVWLALAQVGRRGYARMISEDVRLAQELYRLLDGAPELERFTRSLSITTFRFVPADLSARTAEPAVAEYLDELNRDLLGRIEASGELYVSNAVVAGRFLLRPCIVNFRTTLADVEAIPGIVVRLGREADAALRPAGL
jgi:glutamate/tyrosine decarboxylase-like PLP-dependent enzyme